MTASEILSALGRTIERAAFEFEYLATDRLSDGICATTDGYCDLAGPIVAADMTLDIKFEGFENYVRTQTFTSGTTLYQAVSEEDDEWVALDSHGVGSTVLATLYWLYGIREASPGERVGRYGITVAFDEIFRAAPKAEVDSLRQGLHETRTDLLTASVCGHADVCAAGLISYVELELPAYDGPDPALSQPAILVTLALAPTERRPVEFPEAGRRMSPETFNNLLR
jgi:hypothetical protein